METVGTFDAKNRLSALLDEVERGGEVTITRNGKPVAKLVAVDQQGDHERARRALSQARKLRARLPADALKGTSIRELVDEGRR